MPPYPMPSMGLPPEYSQQLFTNLQGQMQGQRRAANQSIMDNTSRNPAMSGVQQMLLQQSNRGFADQALDLGQKAQLQGVEAQRQDRNTLQQQDWQGRQNDLNREQQMLDRQGMSDRMRQQNGYDQGKSQAALMGGLAGMWLGPLGSAGGSALASGIYGQGQRPGNIPQGTGYYNYGGN